MFQRMAGIHDIFNDDDLAAFEVAIEADEFAYPIAARSTLIRGELDERDLAGDMDLFHQVGHDHEAAIKYTDENRVLVFVGHVDLYADKPDALLDLVIVNDQLKLLLIDRYLHLLIFFYLAR